MEYLVEDTIAMEKTAVAYLTLEAAEGTIDAKEHQQERLEEFTDRVGSGEFHVPVHGTIPCGCVDGRCGGKLRPNAAGGSETIFVADDLTTKRLGAADGTTLGGYLNTLQFLKEKGFEVGGHTDEHAEGDVSGCGANDKLTQIYAFMTRQPDLLRDLAGQFGVEVDDTTHELIIDNAAKRTQFSKGGDLLEALWAKGTKDAIDVLNGSHNEVLVVVNTQEGTSLDRDALEAEFGEDYEAFNVDVWSFEEAARITSLGAKEQTNKVIAMVYYNLATAHVLGGKNLRVVVL